MMASVRAASVCPFCGAKFADAFAKAPGCSHTITGAPDDGVGLGVQIFNLRQSSLPVGWPFATLSCAHVAGGDVAYITAGAQGGTGCGAFQRRAPTGAAAKGIPRNAHDVPRSRPE